MRVYSLLLLMTTCLYARSQDTVNLVLFKQGTRLEYKNYMYDPSSPITATKRRVGQLTRVILTVDSVIKKEGVLKTYITKKGISANNPDNYYKKSFCLQSDGKRVILPYALYFVDTTFTSDINVVGSGRGKYFWSVDMPQNALAFLVPSSLRGVHDIPFDKKTFKCKSWQKDMAYRREGETEYTIRKMYVDGEEKITTKAGTFDCYKMIMEQEVNIMGKHIISRLEIFYNEPNGIVRVNQDTGFMELADVRED